MNISKDAIWKFANAYIISGDTSGILIDTSVTRCKKAILKIWKQKNITLKLIIITHRHHVHMDSVDALKSKTATLAAIHTDNAMEFMSNNCGDDFIEIGVGK